MKLEVRRAGKLCYCKHSKKHAMKKGELRFVVKEPGAGTPELGYCAVCAAAMLDDAESKLAELRSELTP